MKILKQVTTQRHRLTNHGTLGSVYFDQDYNPVVCLFSSLGSRWV